jgi:hypothetical protein
MDNGNSAALCKRMSLQRNTALGTAQIRSSHFSLGGRRFALVDNCVSLQHFSKVYCCYCCCGSSLARLCQPVQRFGKPATMP